MDTEAKDLKSQVAETLKRVRTDPRANNKPVLGVNVEMMNRAKNGGFPKHMYHENADAIVVMNEDEEQAVSRLGYSPYYIRRQFPKILYRRNMDARFAIGEAEEKRTRELGSFVSREPFVEETTVQNAEQEEALLKRPAAKGCGKWVAKITDLEPLPEETSEDAALEIARLKGRLEESEKHTAKSKG